MSLGEGFEIGAEVIDAAMGHAARRPHVDGQIAGSGQRTGDPHLFTREEIDACLGAGLGRIELGVVADPGVDDGAAADDHGLAGFDIDAGVGRQCRDLGGGVEDDLATGDQADVAAVRIGGDDAVNNHALVGLDDDIVTTRGQAVVGGAVKANVHILGHPQHQALDAEFVADQHAGFERQGAAVGRAIDLNTPPQTGVGKILGAQIDAIARANIFVEAVLGLGVLHPHPFTFGQGEAAVGFALGAPVGAGGVLHHNVLPARVVCEGVVQRGEVEVLRRAQIAEQLVAHANDIARTGRGQGTLLLYTEGIEVMRTLDD